MAILKLVCTVMLIMFVISAFFGLAGFLHDIIRYPQKHEKVKIIASADTPEEPTEELDGLILDENISPPEHFEIDL